MRVENIREAVSIQVQNRPRCAADFAFAAASDVIPCMADRPFRPAAGTYALTASLNGFKIMSLIPNRAAAFAKAAVPFMTEQTTQLHGRILLYLFS